MYENRKRKKEQQRNLNKYTLDVNAIALIPFNCKLLTFLIASNRIKYSCEEIFIFGEFHCYACLFCTFISFLLQHHFRFFSVAAFK